MVMAFNLNKLAEVAKPRSEESKEQERFRKENRDWLRISQEIALALRYFLRTEHMTQKALAEKMGLSSVYVSKLLKGGENLTLETICKIQSVIGQDLITVSKPYKTTSVNLPLQTESSATVADSDTYVSWKRAFKNEYIPVTEVIA
jgi:transcriptional regulator with XRE-family HTH domain